MRATHGLYQKRDPRLRYRLFFWGGLFIVLMLTILPLPRGIAWFRPNWTLLFVLYWSLRSPNQLGVGLAWFIGLLKDPLLGFPLGAHAILLATTAYIANKLERRFQMFPAWQQVGVVFLFSFLNELGLSTIQGILGNNTTTPFWYCTSAIVTALLWPWFSTLLHMRIHPVGAD